MSSAWLALGSEKASRQQHPSIEKTQTGWLLACIKRNQDTSIGQRLGFKNILTIHDFQQKIPLSDYESIAPMVDRTANGESSVLFKEEVAGFELTGGSGGGGKLIPYSVTGLNDFRRAIRPWLGNLISQHKITEGSAYWAISPVARTIQETPCGAVIGLPDAAYLGADAAEPIEAVSAVPLWVSTLQDISIWQLVTLYWLMSRQDLTLISVWSPSFFLQLLDTLDRSHWILQDWLENGAKIHAYKLPADPAANRRLNEYLRRHDSRTFWPNLKVVSCWMDASSATFAQRLRKRLPHAHFEAKGLLATEGVITVPNQSGEPVLAAESGFYEFLQDDGTMLLAWELSPNSCYEVVLTTASGLYRYRTGDLVRYEGFADGLPILRFMGRNRLTSDMVGEKLTEAFVTQCIEQIPGFRTLIAINEPAPRYILVAESRYAELITRHLPAIETRLCDNPQYAYARKLGQLAPLTATTMENPLAIYMECNAQQRLGDIKIPALHPLSDNMKRFLEKGG